MERMPKKYKKNFVDLPQSLRYPAVSQKRKPYCEDAVGYSDGAEYLVG